MFFFAACPMTICSRCWPFIMLCCRVLGCLLCTMGTSPCCRRRSLNVSWATAGPSIICLSCGGFCPCTFLPRCRLSFVPTGVCPVRSSACGPTRPWRTCFGWYTTGSFFVGRGQSWLVSDNVGPLCFRYPLQVAAHGRILGRGGGLGPLGGGPRPRRPHFRAPLLPLG